MRWAQCLSGLVVLGIVLPAISGAAQAPPEPPATMSRQGPVDPGSLRDLIGRKVTSIEGDKIGEVEDVVVLEGDRTSLVISIGGFLGIGGKSVTLPYEALSVSSDELVVNMTESQLERQPEFDPESNEGVSLRRGKGAAE